MRRLIAGIATTAVIYVPLTLYLDSDVGPTTPVVALLAGLTFAALAGTMVSSTRGWALRAVGLFLMLAGAAVLMTGLGVNLVHPLGETIEERMLDTVMALWIVGIPLSLFGVGLYWMGGDRTTDDRGGERPDARQDAREVAQNQRETDQNAREERWEAR